MSVASTYGALLLGALVAVWSVFDSYFPDHLTNLDTSLSGILAAQTHIYFKTFPHDLQRIKIIVRVPSRQSLFLVLAYNDIFRYQ